jgi:hypothetical protein
MGALARRLPSPTLTTNEERTAARDLAAADPRLARAIADADRVGFAQTLAGAHELLEHYRTAPPVARLLLDAAADARRLGHRHALTPELLHALTLTLWREERATTRPPDEWFATALTYAMKPLRADEGVRALIPLDPEQTPSTYWTTAMASCRSEPTGSRRKFAIRTRPR